MSTQLLTLLQLCVLALLYLFFVRVLRSVWTEIHAPAASASPPRRSRRKEKVSVGAAGAAAPVARPVPPASRQVVPTQLVVVEPAAQQGLTYGLGGEVTLGRSGACTIRIDDTYSSSMHARITTRPDGALIEDLGSTNGTYVNSQRVTGTVTLQRGDLVQIGSTQLEVR